MGSVLWQKYFTFAAEEHDSPTFTSFVFCVLTIPAASCRASADRHGEAEIR